MSTVLTDYLYQGRQLHSLDLSKSVLNERAYSPNNLQRDAWGMKLNLS